MFGGVPCGSTIVEDQAHSNSRGTVVGQTRHAVAETKMTAETERKILVELVQKVCRIY